MIIDSHTHSALSHDGRISISRLANLALERQMGYLAITEHLDRDYLHGGMRERFVHQLNLAKYDKEFAKAKQQLTDKNFYLAYGIECGFSPKSANRYAKELQAYDYDVIIQSIHTLDGHDVYFPDYFKGKSKSDVYNYYLDMLYQSVTVEYPFQIVGHIGYLTRYAPYSQVSLWDSEFSNKLDALLKEIISRKKTVEINTHITHPTISYLPEKDLLKRYKELGGERITYSSDTHHTEDMCKDYDVVKQLCLDLGFSHWTIYKKQREEFVPIE